MAGINKNLMNIIDSVKDFIKFCAKKLAIIKKIQKIIDILNQLKSIILYSYFLVKIKI